MRLRMDMEGRGLDAVAGESHRRAVALDRCIPHGHPEGYCQAFGRPYRISPMRSRRFVTAPVEHH